MKSKLRKAQDYVLAIRNPLKQQYAAAWFGYRTSLLEHAPEKPKALSVMAAQAVRMRIEEMLGDQT